MCVWGVSVLLCEVLPLRESTIASERREEAGVVIKSAALRWGLAAEMTALMVLKESC